MSATPSSHVVERAAGGTYEPFIHRGKPVGEIRALVLGEPAAAALAAGLWRSGPASYDYLFEADEAFVVLEGAATITLPETGEIVDLVAGDVAYFSAGTRSQWSITQRFLKFVVNPA
jgi:uncharacterized protein